jgi:hypothetical protein
MRRKDGTATAFFLAMLGACLAPSHADTRHNMLTCPLGKYAFGFHQGDNKLECVKRSDDVKYTAAEEFVEGQFAEQGMRACPPGTTMTGIHVGNNLVTCAPYPDTLRVIDRITQSAGMHTCPPGFLLVGVHAADNVFLCGRRPLEGVVEQTDTATERNGMHSCPVGTFLTGIQVGNNHFVCARGFGDYEPEQEIVDPPSGGSLTVSHGMHSCPEGYGVSGVHVGANKLACAPTAAAIPRQVDDTTARFDMHACKFGSLVSGLHVASNRLLCGTQYVLRIDSFQAAPTVPQGTSLKLAWEVACTDPDCVVSVSGGNLTNPHAEVSGEAEGTQTATTAYTLTARSGGTSLSEQRTVAVKP